ncbi:MAG TPA: Ig-like domain-containing protein, partial [Candidatus Saccharimonadales bacterium]|nr:Ig-like domain-containing protein [Candidatus Saccharimonadales bacterium]
MPLVTATLAAAEPPANDDFANRIDLGSGHAATNGVNGDATAELDDPTLSDSVVGRSAWWSWTALTSGPVTITLRGSVPDPDYPESQLGVFRGDTLSSLVLIASSTDGNAVDFSRAGLAQVTFEATAGAAYQIEVDGNWTRPGAYTLNVAPTPPPIVSFTSPLRREGQAYFLAGAPIPLAVQAYDMDGRVLRVEYYAPDQNSIVYQLIGIATNTAFSLSWTNAGLSSHSVVAVATDDLGAVGVAVPVEVNVRPFNDDFSHRLSVSGTSLTVTGSTLGATHEVDEAQANGNSVWWSWTAPAAGTVTVTTEGAFTIGVYIGSTVSNLNQVALATSIDSGLTTRAIFTALAGTTYDIAVGSTSQFGGDVTLQIAQSAPPTVTILTPTNNARYTSGQLVTYSVSAADSDGGVVRVEYFRDFEFIGAASNSPFALQLTEDTPGPVGLRLEARAVDDHGVLTRSAEVFYTVYPEPPANDQFANRIALSGSFATVTGSLAYATAEAGEPAELRGHSVWWAWTAPAAGMFTATLGSEPGFYPVLAVYTGTDLSNLVLLADNSFAGQDNSYSVRVVFEAVAGTTYLIGGASQSDSGGACSLSMRHGLPPAVSISSPLDGAILTLGSNLTIQVAAADADGQVVQVDYFLSNGTPL